MRIPKLGVKDTQATVILGAGASRGASCFEDSLLPAPLDSDFFSLMQHVQHLDPLLGGFLDFLRDELGTGACPRMEEFFTQLEALDEFHINLKIQPGPKVRRYSVQLGKFVNITAAFFRQIYLRSGKGHRTCEFHGALAKALNAGDSILSFNYDCLMDMALKEAGGRSWNSSGGYGVVVENGAEAWQSTFSGPGPRARDSIRLLKLHGSLNWDRTGACGPAAVKLRDDPYSSLNRSSNEIVPPVWDKTIGDDDVYCALWKEARRILRTGPVLISVGYSVPPTDLLSQALIRVAAAERASTRKLSHLIVVNPDVHSRAKFIDLVKHGMSPNTIIVELNSLKELKSLLE